MPLRLLILVGISAMARQYSLCNQHLEEINKYRNMLYIAYRMAANNPERRGFILGEMEPCINNLREYILVVEQMNLRLRRCESAIRMLLRIYEAYRHMAEENPAEE